ncbi:UNVERIFIED_CONTAM: hypothetical protein PYX00_006615 [Menopon gallinae]|uniref:ubiquitinyl hydrolase 1 n=1 Tax=Menopon gallinae TaxID=328185 RepID=A0AAW2HX26_9NEOP
MSENSQSSGKNKSYSHGIIRCNCVVRKSTEAGCAVKTVHVGTLIEIHNVRQENVLFCIVKNDLQTDYDLFLCKKGDIVFVPENLWGPLMTVEENVRLSIVQDTELAEALGNITVGTTVKVLKPDFKDLCVGTVTFKNAIAKLGLGVYFGLKITNPECDLQYIKENYSLLEPGTKGFPRGCDIVVSVDKIRPLDLNKETSNLPVKNHHTHTDKNVESNSSHLKSKYLLNLKNKNGCNIKSSQDRNASSESSKSGLNNKQKIYDIPLSIGEEVVYISDTRPEKGTVQWVGFINNSLKVGVEFENPIGSGSGSFEGEELFKAQYLHALLMPPESLIKLSDFEMNNSKDYSSQQKTTNNNNYNNLRSNNQYCSWKHNIEDKKKILKINSLQNSNFSTHSGDSFQVKNCNEDYSERDLGCNRNCKSDYSICISQMHYPSRSFDSSRPTERKIGNNRQSKSMDNDLPQNKELLANLENSLASMEKSPSKDLVDFSHGWTEHCELHNVYGSDPHHGVSDFNARVFKEHCDYPHTTKKKNTSVNGPDIWETHNSEHSSSDESPEYYDTPKPSLDNISSDKLGKGSVVELVHKGQPYYGVIRWIGTIPDNGDTHPSRLIAGIEMEEEVSGFTDGTFHNKKYFNCNPNKALFVPLSECRKDSRFVEETNKHNNSMKINSFGQLDCPVVQGTVPPINGTKGDLEAICGKNRGIQGHHNSCYLDATLFAMFAFTSVFDSLLYRPASITDIPQYGQVQRVLKEEIVNPLRKNFYVRADRVMKLRTLLENLSSVTGLTCEEKDPEEFLNSLLAQILKAEPFLKLSSGQETFHYQLFVEKDERLTFPSVQQLFEQSFVTSDIKLKQIPSCLIIQMPRFGKSFKMYSRIFPHPLLDVTDIIENSPRQCTVCGKLAEYECKDCFGQNGIGNGLESISFCKTCLETAHNHHCRMRHNYRPITVPFEFFDLQEHCTIPRIYMELFAVVCIETSHYVAFVKCGPGSEAPWCFFDSMADRKGEQNGYNIPEMVPCPNLPYWLSEEGAKALNEMDERQLPEHAKRLLCDAYMCMYQSPDIMMYR